MILLKNKRTGVEYYVDEAEYADLKKNGLLIKYNILTKKVEKPKTKATVEVMNFIKKHEPKQVESEHLGTTVVDTPKKPTKKQKETNDQNE